MKRLNLALLITILSVLFAAISSILSNAISLPPPIKGLALPLLGLCVVFMIVITLTQQIQGQKNTPSLLSFELLKASHPQNRSRMLQLVKRNWIHGYLEPSLFTKQALLVEVSYQPNAVETPSSSKIGPSLPNSSLFLQNLYDLSQDGLLILGGSGAGKTTALLELTRTLLDHARDDDSQPIPVVFSLSSWDVKQAPLHEWLAQELLRYRVSQQLAQFWIETDQLLPLLDDFDMVADSCRAACIQAINSYRQRHGLIPLVVCSRNEEYRAQPVRLHLGHAVVIQPLSSALVTTYLTQGGQKLKSIRIILRKYPQLLSYLRLPRHLDMLARSIAEHPASAQEYISLLQVGNSRVVEQKLLTKYVQQQLQQMPSPSVATPVQVRQTLHWLALGMKTHHQISFALEELQPNWLPDEQLRQEAQQRVRLWILFIFLIFGQLSGVLLSQSGRLPLMTMSFILSLIAGYRFLRLVKKVSFIQKPDLDISMIEVISWAWKHKRERLINTTFRIGCISLLIAGGIGMLFGLLFSLWEGWKFGLLSGFFLCIFALACLFAGGSATALRIGLVRHHLSRPGDGIWRSARHSLMYGLLLGGGVGILAFGITQSLQFGFKFSGWFAIALGISCGISMGLLCGLINGGYALLQHYALRSIMKKAGLIPGKLPALLNIAVQCRLLCLVNSSFIFPHRWLLDYFASRVHAEESVTSY